MIWHFSAILYLNPAPIRGDFVPKSAPKLPDGQLLYIWLNPMLDVRYFAGLVVLVALVVSVAL